jgi:Flp pilus assembly protein TadG
MIGVNCNRGIACYVPSTQRRWAERRCGSALVEFALLLPVILLLSLLMIQFSLILNTVISLSHLSREGARYAAVSPGSDADIFSRIQSMTPPQLRYSDMKITVTPPESGGGRSLRQPITVTITYDMRKKLILPPKFLGLRIFSPEYTTRASAMIE